MVWRLLRFAGRRLMSPWGNAPVETSPVGAHHLGDDSLRLAIAGDVGHPSAALDATVGEMARASATRRFDALVLLGDNVYPDGDPSQLETAVLEPFAPLLSAGTPLLAVLGNHDVQGGHGDELARRLGMPGRWYATRLGAVLFVGLDSTQPHSSEQRAWLAATLASTDAVWVVVALHHPPYSAGWHGSERQVRRAFVPLFRRFGVDLVLAGHEHDYQRLKPRPGTTYVISGAATHLRPTARARFTAAASSTHHFLDLWASKDRLEVTAVDHHGTVFDRLVLFPGRRQGRRPPVQPLLSGSLKS